MSNDNSTFSIENGHGDLICEGLPAHTAHATAQRIADKHGEPVYLYCPAEGDEDHPAPSVRIEPSEEHKAVTVTVAYDESDRSNVGWAYWATYPDGEPEGSGSLGATDEEDEDAAVAEAQALYPNAKVVVE